MPASSPNAPAVSAVVAAYNGERFVGRALDSLLTQTIPDLEVIASTMVRPTAQAKSSMPMPQGTAACRAFTK